MNEWTSIKEKCPDKSDCYLCNVIIPYENGRHITSLKLLRWYAGHGYFSCEGMIVTHWMPVPKAPEVKIKWD